jgi:hypothetical protein
MLSIYALTARTICGMFVARKSGLLTLAIRHGVQMYTHITQESISKVVDFELTDCQKNSKK